MAQFGQRQRGVGGAAVPWGRGGGNKPKAGQNVYLLDATNKVKPVWIRTGITDGHYTEVAGGDLKEGDNVIVGLATSKVEGPPPPGARRGGPMGR